MENQNSDKITNFRGKYFWLSNFYPCTILYDGFWWSSVENAYQASKTSDVAIKRLFQNFTPSQAKKYGKQVELIPHWEELKILKMRDILIQKFKDPKLQQKLLNTGNREIIEENNWNDTYWGVCNEVGENNLGKIIMDIRQVLKNSIQ